MKSVFLAAAFALAASVSLGGCQAVPAGTASDAMKATQVAITTYADIYQPAVITYGNLPLCGDGAPPICKNPVVFQKLKAADLAVTKTIIAAQEVLEGKVTDTGQITEAVLAIAQAEATIANSGALFRPN